MTRERFFLCVGGKHSYIRMYESELLTMAQILNIMSRGGNKRMEEFYPYLNNQNNKKVSNSAVSHNIFLLVAAGLLRIREDGRSRIVTMSPYGREFVKRKKKTGLSWRELFTLEVNERVKRYPS